MRFFVPDVPDDPAAAEARWNYYIENTPAPAGSRRVYRLNYMHGGDRYELTVGQPRKVFKRKTGPRGGYIKNAEPVSYGQSTGTMVSAIIDTGSVLYVWSYGPPFGGWANPSLVGKDEVLSIEYFEETPSS